MDLSNIIYTWANSSTWNAFGYLTTMGVLFTLACYLKEKKIIIMFLPSALSASMLHIMLEGQLSAQEATGIVTIIPIIAVMMFLIFPFSEFNPFNKKTTNKEATTKTKQEEEETESTGGENG